jgi:hypothetical protein
LISAQPGAVLPLTTRTLRNFALTVAGGVALVFTLLPWVFRHGFRLLPLGVAFALVAWGLAAPGRLAPFYRAWMRLGTALGWVNSRVILFLVFWLVIVPTGVFYRIFRRTERAALHGFDPSLKSYRVSSRPYTRESMERPF